MLRVPAVPPGPWRCLSKIARCVCAGPVEVSGLWGMTADDGETVGADVLLPELLGEADGLDDTGDELEGADGLGDGEAAGFDEDDCDGAGVVDGQLLPVAEGDGLPTAPPGLVAPP